MTTRNEIRRPLQNRSRATLQRLAGAAAQLLEERPWHQISIAEIVATASSSVGSFYARFPDKDALLDFLDEGYTGEVLDLHRQIEELIANSAPDLGELVAQLVGELVRFHRRRRGLIRALVQRARTYREPRYNQRTQRMNVVVRALVSELAARLPEELGDERDRRAFFGFSFLFSALRDRILFPESIAPIEAEASDEELAVELTHATLAYLERPATANKEYR